MDTLFFDTHNILLNGQPYPFNSIRPRYPVVAGDNTAALYFPWWRTNALWSGDVTQLINGLTSAPFTGITDFKAFVDAHFYTDTFSGGISYLGTWDASTNTPFLANGTGTAGDFYITSVAGSVDFGAGSITFAVGDLVIYNGTIWEKADFAAITEDLQQVTDAGSTSTHNLQIAGLLDQSAAPAIAFNVNGFTVLKSSNTIYDSSLNQAKDNSGNVSASFDFRVLSDSSGNGRYHWNTNKVNDGSATISADLDNRQLFASDGSPAVDYLTPGEVKGMQKIVAVNNAGNPNVELNTEDSTFPNVIVYNYATKVGVALQCTTVPTIKLSENTGADSILLKCTALSGSGAHDIDFQAASGTVAFLSDIPSAGFGNFAVTGTAGMSGYNLPHGLSYTPAFATIVAKNAATAALLVGGYYLGYTSSAIVLQLSVATVGTPSIDIDWAAV